MASEFVQAERRPTDGAIHITRVDHHQGSGEDSILIGHEGTPLACNGESITLSEYNAARVLAGLAVILGVRLNREDAKRIKL